MHDERPGTDLEKLLQSGMSSLVSGGFVSSPMPDGLEEALRGGEGFDATGLQGANMPSGSLFHSGPAEGGGLFERPAGGYFAHSSIHEGVSIDRMPDDNMSSIARSIDEAATLTVDGERIDLLDCLPGGDIVQLAAGRGDPMQIMMSLAQHGMSQPQEPAREQGEATTSGEICAASGCGDAETETPSQGAAPEEMSAALETGASACAGDAARRLNTHGEKPDHDQNARDMERLLREHALNLRTAVETSDEARVHTEIHAHGRTMAIDTDFEARSPDNEEEKKEAEEHVDEALRSPRQETESAGQDMRFRSRILAQLHAASHDEGMSL